MGYRNACNICGATSSEWIGPKDDVCMHCSEYVNGIELREQERIIKLLEEETFNDWLEIKLANLIELIKGETNE